MLLEHAGRSQLATGGDLLNRGKDRLYALRKWVRRAEQDQAKPEAGIDPSVGSVGEIYDNATGLTNLEANPTAVSEPKGSLRKTFARGCIP